jgi:FtsP/CotA-like multicopper oxidase with cupredoxin domain
MTIPVIERGPIDDEKHFREFSTDVPTFSQDRPLDEIPGPDYIFERKMYHGHDIPLPDGRMIEVWGFYDPDDDSSVREQFPSKPIRVPEGALVHGHFSASHGPHTIHWHGIEPMASSDGVGKLSFEVTGNYVYQWLAAEAGTYFYHCHRNTTLHFEYGMYGALIIDPRAPSGSDLVAPYAFGGPGYARRIDELVRYDVEGIWVSDDMDPRWHTLDKDSGIGARPFEDPDKDPGLNVFEPKYFFITGVPHPWSTTDPKVVVHAQVGQTLLLRIICAGYTYHKWQLGIDAEVVAMDGRTLGHEDGVCNNSYSHPFMLPANTPFELTPARRWDLLVRPTAPGIYPAGFTSRHISNGRPAVLGEAQTFIVVS